MFDIKNVTIDGKRWELRTQDGKKWLLHTTYAKKCLKILGAHTLNYWRRKGVLFDEREKKK